MLIYKSNNRKKTKNKNKNPKKIGQKKFCPKKCGGLDLKPQKGEQHPRFPPGPPRQY